MTPAYTDLATEIVLSVVVVLLIGWIEYNHEKKQRSSK